MKTIFYSFLIGLVIGGGIIFLFLSKSTPVQATMNISSSNPKTRFSEETLTVKQNHKTVKAIASFQLNNKEIITNTITINRRNLQYKHSLVFQSGYFINSQLVFLDLGYSYQWLLISTKIGYSFRLQEMDYGLGIGAKYSW